MTRFMIAIAALFLTAADEPLLVPDVSQREIEIAYSFTGAELLLFGAILYPDGRTPARDADIVVTVRGPAVPIRVWEKQRVFGIWANAESVRFQSAPGFYAVASSRPVETLIDERTAAIFELGVGNLQLSPADPLSSQEIREFEKGLVSLRQRTRLFRRARQCRRDYPRCSVPREDCAPGPSARGSLRCRDISDPRRKDSRSRDA